MPHAGTELLEQDIRRTRKEILDLFETVINDERQWRIVRAKVMKLFGRDGLEQYIVEKDQSCAIDCKRQG